VPFYLRTGKRLPHRTTEIAIQFRRSPFVLFRKTKIADLQTNRLVIHIQPDEGISLRFGAKVPGPVMQLGLVNMEFDYARDFGRSHSTGYERLLYDCMIGDATLFQRADMVEAGLEGDSACSRRLEGNTSSTISQLRRKHLGARRSRRIAGPRWPGMANDRRRAHPVRA